MIVFGFEEFKAGLRKPIFHKPECQESMIRLHVLPDNSLIMDCPKCEKISFKL